MDKYGVKVIGVNLDAIERGEDREIFKETMKALGIDTPRFFWLVGLSRSFVD